MRLGSTRDTHEEHAYTEAGGVSNVNKNIFGNSSRDIWWGVALGLSVSINVIALWSWTHAATEAQVKDYNLTFFMSHDWVEVKTKVDTDHQLIEAYWPRELTKETQDGRRRDNHH
jgi:hypothetical protein